VLFWTDSLAGLFLPVVFLALWATAPSYGAEEAAAKLVVPDGKAYKGKKITAKTYNSGFALGHDSYNAMGTGSDGKIYYVLSSRTLTRAQDVLPRPDQ
jgi:hypothetical protein